MNSAIKIWCLMTLYGAGSAAAMAQQPAGAPTPSPAPDAAAGPSTGKPAKATAQSEAGEPRADTSSPDAGQPADRPVTTTPAPPAAPATDRKATVSRPSGDRTAADRAAADRTAAGTGQKSGSKVDRLDLGTATVTGDREQPKVMYIVPWKKSDIGDLAGKPMNSLVDEILAPVDRDVFKREVVYYHAVQADASQNGAPPKPAQQGEK
jgi:hypothetical protein